LVDVTVSVASSPSMVQVVETPPAEVEVTVGGVGPRGLPGADGEPGAPGNTNVFISATDPDPAPGFGAYIWFVLDGTGSVIDIRKGVA